MLVRSRRGRPGPGGARGARRRRPSPGSRRRVTSAPSPTTTSTTCASAARAGVVEHDRRPCEWRRSGARRGRPRSRRRRCRRGRRRPARRPRLGRDVDQQRRRRPRPGHGRRSGCWAPGRSPRAARAPRRRSTRSTRTPVGRVPRSVRGAAAVEGARRRAGRLSRLSGVKRQISSRPVGTGWSATSKEPCGCRWLSTLSMLEGGRGPNRVTVTTFSFYVRRGGRGGAIAAVSRPRLPSAARSAG